MRNRIITLLFCAASVLTLWAVASSKPVSPYTIDTPYEYPILPGTQAWLDLGDVIARRSACQVPTEILERMTTDALLLTVLDYPFLHDIYAFNTMQMGYEAVRNHCNSLREFENRPDYLDVLSRYCQENDSPSGKARTLDAHMAEDLYRLYAGGVLEPAS